ncbi:winged helix DNA-binding protein [Aminithiophilus ramosus]|uniref:Winged helix DNA-binding protein n=1 Tax=Aminithiophilus ramosus TaxID=3029084 RepID=A0A9Q7AN69_9BACT|nr:MarR family transcriptional regulator [Aminithiophilus ramosus]QTX32557.1 winged helix DNA-binding protein [Aminithiophilus ramosus]
MKITPNSQTRISYGLLFVIVRLQELERKTHTYGTDEPLFIAEIHMVKAIREHPEAHLTALADRLGVTKGAVSQLVKKLEEKGMIVKDRDPANRARVVLSLTAKGEKAYALHERAHRDFDDLVEGLLQEATAEERAFLQDFISRLTRALDRFSTVKE